jgi:hypothetical protein
MAGSSCSTPVIHLQHPLIGMSERCGGIGWLLVVIWLGWVCAPDLACAASLRPLRWFRVAGMSPR